MTKTTFLAVALAALALVGCDDSQSDLDQWMTEQRQTVKPAQVKVTPPVVFVPFNYDAQTLPDPFSNEKLAATLRRQGAGAGSALIAAEQGRRREPLESVPLDSMTMVGSLERGGQKVALVRADNLLHQVRVGNYLGQDYGRVVGITETEVRLRELIQDGDGNWTERPTTLHLQEGGSNGKQ